MRSDTRKVPIRGATRSSASGIPVMQSHRPSHAVSVTWDRKRPWTALARSLVLYRPQGQWRFAVYNEAGIMDGHLPDLGGDASVDEAQAALLTMVEVPIKCGPLSNVLSNRCGSAHLAFETR